MSEAKTDFPKWMHHTWVATPKGGGHHAAKESKLAHTPEEAKALAAKGWTEEAPKADAKKEEAKAGKKDVAAKE